MEWQSRFLVYACSKTGEGQNSFQINFEVQDLLHIYPNVKPGLFSLRIQWWYLW